jgi:hypothetical protein
MMINNDELAHLSSLVQKAEEKRNSQNITALKRYVTNTPELSVQTFHLTNEIKERLIFYIASGDKEKEDNIRQELEVLRAQLDTMNEQSNILFSLLAEEIILSFLMMRQCDATYARHYANLSTQALRRAEVSHVRLMRTLRTLASIQRLVPVINVNIGGTQQIAITK